MCKSSEEGGARCAAHTRPAYEALMEQIESTGTGFGTGDKRKRIRNTFRFGDQNALNAVADYASTPSGLKHVLADKERFAHDPQMSAFLNSCAAKGKNRHGMAKEVADTIRKERAREVGKATGWASQMIAHNDLSLDASALGACPRIEELWNRDDNNGIGPEQVKRQANCTVMWRCKPKGHLNEAKRLNNVVNVLNAGGMMICDECQPARTRQLKATQEDLADLVKMMDDDPDAFAALSSATQYEVLQKLGLLGAGQDSMQRSLALNMVHGDLTLKEVMLAEDLSRLDKKMKDLTDDEEDLGAVTDIDMTDMKVKDLSTGQRIKQVMSSSGAMGMFGEDSPLGEHILRENVEALWEQAYANPDDIDSVLAAVNSNRGRSAGAAKVADHFTDELERVRAMGLPDGYRTERTKPDGSIDVMDPTLSQRRFSALVEDRRRVMNWSGTGAGKTLAATLAIQNTDARETLVVCPNAVVGQWEEAFKSGFPDNTEVHVGLPTGNEAPAADGVNRVWVVNYDKFQGDEENLDRRITALSGNVDAVVFDEIHMAKKSDASTSSRRRNALEKFTDAAGAANPDLVVIGASATPVVNNLEEAASVLRLVEGPESRKFPTAPTMKNAAAAHQRIAEAGVRHMPTYPTKMTREDVTVDISESLGKVNARVEAMQSQRKGKSVHPAIMERALLPEKMPKIIAAVKKSKTPSVVYTEYIDGMVEPMEKAFQAEGMRVGHYTGQESATERAATLKSFRNGEYDVLIGSKPIATGVDGLQNISNNLVIASMPWTAAADDQLVGRLQRRGQQNDVNITYVLTEAKVGKARWSWCKDNRQKRVRFKRSLADAAVDGIMPDGVIDAKNFGADDSFSALQKLVAA